MKENERKEVSQRSVIVLNAGGMIIVVASSALTWLIATSLGIPFWKLSFFASFRTLLLILFSVLLLPLGAFGEYWLSSWRKRKFLWKSLGLVMGLSVIFVLINVLLSTAFDMLGSALELIWQVPLAVVSNSISLIATVLVIRTNKLRKWRKDLGW